MNVNCFALALRLYRNPQPNHFFKSLLFSLVFRFPTLYCPSRTIAGVGVCLFLFRHIKWMLMYFFFVFAAPTATLRWRWRQKRRSTTPAAWSGNHPPSTSPPARSTSSTSPSTNKPAWWNSVLGLMTVFRLDAWKKKHHFLHNLNLT